VTAAGPLWADFSFVVSSGYRERVLASLSTKPRLPGQLADETDLRLAHVSRALRELSDRGLVECLTPEVKARGRLYGLTAQGSVLLAHLRESDPLRGPSKVPDANRFTFVPKIRGSSVLRLMRYLETARGGGAVTEALKGWAVDPRGLSDDTWLSVEDCADFLDRMEAKFGDGSYGFIRSAFAQSVATFPTIREELARAVPLEALAERSPIVYSKEWNYGRMEVQVGRRRAAFLHYDWMPTPAMCAMFHGIYDGILRARGFSGKVTKTRCVRNGDDHCEYVVEW
jgi:DNA-binding MarR family transcriptional regulator